MYGIYNLFSFPFCSGHRWTPPLSPVPLYYRPVYSVGIAIELEKRSRNNKITHTSHRTYTTGDMLSPVFVVSKKPISVTKEMHKEGNNC